MTIKRIWRVIGLAVVIAAFLSFPLSGVAVGGYKPGDTIDFGSYPQSSVKDEKLISELNALDFSWMSYNYYSGTGAGQDGEMKPGDFMRYADVEYNGEKFRAVIKDAYRPRETYEKSSTYESNKEYNLNTIYWFKYEPIRWIVLDPTGGLVLSERILDAQPFNNFSVMNMENYNADTGMNYFCFFGNADMTSYASDYKNSSLRKWLTTDFFNLAFSNAESANISTVTLNNDCYNKINGISFENDFDFQSTDDKIFVLSYSDLYTGDILSAGSDYEKLYRHYFYGDSSRIHSEAQGTDYALCQDLDKQTNEKSSSYGLSTWILRTAMHSNFVCSVGADAHVGVNETGNCGVRPAMKIDLGGKVLSSADKSNDGSGAAANIAYIAIAAGVVLVTIGVVVCLIRRFGNK